MKRCLGFDIDKSSLDYDVSVAEGDPGLGSLLLSLSGLESSQSLQTSAENQTLTDEDFSLCPTCEAEVAKWNETFSQRAEEEAAEEYRSRLVYDALACFATGALMGIVVGILRD